MTFLTVLWNRALTLGAAKPATQPPHSVEDHFVLDMTGPIRELTMDDRQRELDRRIRTAQRREFLRQLSEMKVLIALGGVMLVIVIGGAMFSATPTKLQATVNGRTLNEATARADRQGKAVRLEVVQLDNGGVIDLNMTADRAVPPGTAIRVEVYEKDFRSAPPDVLPFRRLCGRNAWT